MFTVLAHGDEVAVKAAASSWNTKWYFVVPLVTLCVSLIMLAGLIYISKAAEDRS